MASSWAVITGASSGLGAQFARVFATRGYNLVLLARRPEPMERLAEELKAGAHIETRVLPIDLSASDSVQQLTKYLGANAITPDVLVNNAAFGLTGDFIDQEPQSVYQMLQLDVVSMVSLTQAVAQKMVAAGRGHILLVGSLAAYQPCPLMAAYGAAKSFVLSFGEALHVELAGKVNVTVVSPGLMETEFFQVANYTPKKSMKASMLPARVVAEKSVIAMFERKPSIVIGTLNKISAFSTRLFSRHAAALFGYRMTKA